MTKLIYHPLSSTAQTSPFDEAAVLVAQSGPIRIVSPYIGVAYLERLIAQSGGAWQLITDVEAWLGSLSFRARPRAWTFIRENLEDIHHCPDIHAKLVLSDSLAMMGSANLTKTGILGRTEMGILIDELALIQELQDWFADLWLQTDPPVVDEASAFIQWLDDEAELNPIRRQKAALSSATQKVRATLSALPSLSTKTQEAPLALATVAQTLLVAEQKHYESLDQAMIAMLDNLAIKGFTLGDAVQNIRAGYPAGQIREIYFGLLRHTTNHVRSVFAEDTISRLILTKGRFVQSNRESITAALDVFDRFMSYLVFHLSFDEPRELPSEPQIEHETGIIGREQVLLVSELLDCGFLILEDVPGRLALYLLDQEFEWEGRYKLFERSRQTWIGLSRQTKKTPNGYVTPEDEEDLVEFDDEQNPWPTSRIHGTWLPDEEHSDTSIHYLGKYLAEANDIRVRARERKQKEEQLRTEMIDRTTALLLKRIFAGKRIHLAC